LSLIKIPSEHKVISLAITDDASLLYYGTHDFLFGVADMNTGNTLSLLGSDRNLVKQICCGNGNEVFLGCGKKLTISNFSDLLPTSYNKKYQMTEKKSMLFKIIMSKKDLVYAVYRSGLIVVWQPDQLGVFKPLKDIHLREKIGSAYLSDNYGFLVVTSENNAIVYDVEREVEILRVSESMPLKNAIISRFKQDSNWLIYVWRNDNHLSAWKISGREDLFFSVSCKPVFETHATIFPTDASDLLESQLLIANYTRAIVLDAFTGKVLNEYTTRSREAIVDIGLVFGNNLLKAHTIYATKSSLYFNGKIISYGGSLGDLLQIENCKSHEHFGLVAYSAIQWLESSGISLAHQQVRYIGVVVVLDISETSTGRKCQLRHDGVRVDYWAFLNDGNHIVTIGTDQIIRVWDISGVNQEAYITCTFPLQSRAVSLAASASNPILYVGDEHGDLITLMYKR
jgi:WD40 repeat protein